MHYGLLTQSFDLEPKRYVSVIKQKVKTQQLHGVSAQEQQCIDERRGTHVCMHVRSQGRHVRDSRGSLRFRVNVDVASIISCFAACLLYRACRGVGFRLRF